MAWMPRRAIRRLLLRLLGLAFAEAPTVVLDDMMPIDDIGGI